MEEIFWEREGFEALLKLHCIGSYKLCLCIEPVPLTAFYQNSHHLLLQEVVTHSVHLLSLVAVNGYWPRNRAMFKTGEVHLRHNGQALIVLVLWKRKHVVMLVHVVKAIALGLFSGTSCSHKEMN